MSHRVQVLVHGYHCDLYGHVNNARYLEFLEGARWQTLQGRVDVEDWHRRGWRFVVVKVEIHYRSPARMGEVLEIDSHLGRVGRASAEFAQTITQAGNGRRVAEATITFVVLDDATQRPLRLEGEVLDALSALPTRRSPEGDR